MYYNICMKSNKYINSINKNIVFANELKWRTGLIIMIFIFCMLIISVRLLSTTVFQHAYFQNHVRNATLQEVTLNSAPRGKIFDRNHNVIVDNVTVKTIYYQKPPRVTMRQELETIEKLLELVEIDPPPLTENQLIDYFVLLNPEDTRALLTDAEQTAFEERRMTRSERDSLIRERVKEAEMMDFDETKKHHLAILRLMNRGYRHEPKILKNQGVTDVEYISVLENVDRLNGINARLEPKRYYPHGNVFRTMLGRVSSSETGLPLELKEYYLANGFSLNDQVGISNLELQFEDILRGIKPVYQLNRDNQFERIRPGRRGQDIVLTIDIELQRYVERVLTEEIRRAKREPNTRHFNRSFVIITEPSTGEILAMSGKQMNDRGQIVDFTPGIITQPVTAGSVVKGASMIVALNEGAFRIGERVMDECIRLRATPIKCSWRPLGMVDSISAMAMSSNVYQFKAAMRVAGANYVPGGPLIIRRPVFDIYRSTFAEFGLGVPTNINFNNESLGNRGSGGHAGAILDLAIGQYDTYTPLQISSYINTIANRGTRKQLSLLKSIYESDTYNDLENLVFNFEPTVLGVVNTTNRYMEEVIRGFRAVMTNGTGIGAMGRAPTPAGKTGTSQSFIDTTGDGRVDTETISTAFVGFAPMNNPQMTVTVISPDVSTSGADFRTGVNRRISARVSTFFFADR